LVINITAPVYSTTATINGKLSQSRSPYENLPDIITYSCLVLLQVS
jgi:hypothetical protein